MWKIRATNIRTGKPHDIEVDGPHPDTPREQILETFLQGNGKNFKDPKIMHPPEPKADDAAATPADETTPQ